MLADDYFSSTLEEIIRLETGNLVEENSGTHEKIGDLLYRFGKKVKQFSPEEMDSLREQVENIDLTEFENDLDYQKIKPAPLIEINHYFPENKGYLLFIVFRKACRHFSQANNLAQTSYLKEKKAKCFLELAKLSEKIHLANKTKPKNIFNQVIHTFSELEKLTQDSEQISYYNSLKAEAQLKLADLNKKDLRGYLTALTSFEKSLQIYKNHVEGKDLRPKDRENISRLYSKIGWTYFKIGQQISEIPTLKNPLVSLLKNRLKADYFTAYSFALDCYNHAQEYLCQARKSGDQSVESKSKTGSVHLALAQLKLKRWTCLKQTNLPDDILKRIPHPPKKLEEEINISINNALGWYNLAARQDPNFLIPNYFKCLIAAEFKNIPFINKDTIFKNPDQPWEEFYQLIVNTPNYFKWEMTRSQTGVVIDRHGLIERRLVFKRSNHLERIIFEKLHQYNQNKKQELNLKKDYLFLPKIIYTLPKQKILALEHGQQTLYEKVKILSKDIQINENNIEKVIAQGKDPENFKKKLSRLKKQRTELYKSAIQQLIRTDQALKETMPEILEELKQQDPSEAQIVRLEKSEDYITCFDERVIQTGPFKRSPEGLEEIIKNFAEKISAMPSFIYSDFNPCNIAQFTIDKENIKEMAYLFDAAILLYHEGPGFELKEIRKLFCYIINERERVIDPQRNYKTISQEKRDRYFSDFDYISVFRLFTLIGNEQEKINNRLKKIPESKKYFWENLLVNRQKLYLNYIKEICQFAVSDKCHYHQPRDKDNFKKLYESIKKTEIASPKITVGYSRNKVQEAS